MRPRLWSRWNSARPQTKTLTLGSTPTPLATIQFICFWSLHTFFWKTYGILPARALPSCHLFRRPLLAYPLLCPLYHLILLYSILYVYVFYSLLPVFTSVSFVSSIHTLPSHCFLPYPNFLVSFPLHSSTIPACGRPFSVLPSRDHSSHVLTLRRHCPLLPSAHSLPYMPYPTLRVLRIFTCLSPPLSSSSSSFLPCFSSPISSRPLLMIHLLGALPFVFSAVLSSRPFPDASQHLRRPVLSCIV